MYMIGDKVLHPMHGAGIIVDVEIIKVLGEEREYYCLEIPGVRMELKIPKVTCDEVGIRPIVGEEVIPEVYHVLEEPSRNLSNNWNKRFRENMELLKSGDILCVAQVVRDLIRSDRRKPLSAGEKKMLSGALQVLESEIHMVTGKSTDCIREIISEHV